MSNGVSMALTSVIIVIVGFPVIMMLSVFILDWSNAHPRGKFVSQLWSFCTAFLSGQK